ncbi:MAG: hypothetical protein UT12_C0011G0046 [Candidatus Curtissbacteria bacterium GW2011_GWC2_38_9]|uniref:Uncharacterized protein n=3 Tax=Candidatus Curtissiibacteriota TaxID=1752717 RepID=A0A1F5HUZ2_9BACT|nr:MAG: hypothetical protein UT12_C0011G0046 [Candidatus Curtissbacteria bacterium GW2011_GWC2_38_9]KKS05065.1 MAG: hypothetical protein UU56_C0001G0032 [Candidatus Curtissbacteria bacterium GW2011_GWA2_41_24]OGD90633.1 MAG: hypothetical protein A2Z54_01570 [Candidatus Curtissbacteria bacterium RIFCSPHIGHO2_02_39_8]OGE07913.1 MAG: hypothetical protein A2W70_00475 [Candidatus Curtissbacteria bacterium RIFCSPLOWO2_02_41_11]
MNRKLADSLILSSILVVIFIPAVTVAAELIPPLKEWLKNTFSHHWIGKSIISLILFVGFGVLTFLIPYKTNLEKINRLIMILITITALATLTIFGFFSYEALLK